MFQCTYFHRFCSGAAMPFSRPSSETEEPVSNSLRFYASSSTEPVGAFLVAGSLHRRVARTQDPNHFPFVKWPAAKQHLTDWGRNVVRAAPRYPPPANAY
ncbi:hypothetical protein KIL84_011866 [Mauremys mutica]|uniref:Uncharacterized protein n=1 Tax=Mauremys mutica TaxID=74926 RepID=A0A9D3XAH2_9SAUR|nr:hypothetical protein KIL84_011866 [Mauremys mutica]